MRCFDNIAKLIRDKRLSHPRRYSQSELSNLLGYKNGQFISNVERGLCSIPLKMLSRVSEVLNIPPSEIRAVMLRDQETTLNNHLNIEIQSSVVPFPGNTNTVTNTENTNEPSDNSNVEPLHREGFGQKIKIAAEG